MVTRQGLQDEDESSSSPIGLHDDDDCSPSETVGIFGHFLFVKEDDV